MDVDPVVGGRWQGCALAVALLVFVWAMPPRSELLAQAGAPCDPALESPAGNPHGYSIRGDRCEGLYIQEVSGSSSLLVASLTRSFSPYNPGGGDLRVEWASPGHEPVWIRAYSLRRRLYYRMDTVRPAESGRYEWPVGILTALNIAPNDLGVVGWTSFTVGTLQRKVYLPLRVSQQLPAGTSRGYRVTLVPSVDLKEVFVSLGAVQRDGNVGTLIQEDVALGMGYYPADRPIAFSTPELTAPGIYSLVIGATLSGGGSSATELFLYHSGT